MKKLLLIMICFIGFSGCSASNRISFNNLINSNKFKGEESVLVRGYLYLDELGMKFFQGENSDIYLDIVVSESTEIDQKLEDCIYTCVEIFGVFEKYEDGTILVGNLSSKYGLINSARIKRCKKE